MFMRLDTCMGLSDQYEHAGWSWRGDPNNRCNANVTSVMDGLDENEEPCDGGSLTTWDITQVSTFYKYGVLSNFAVSANDQGDGVVVWLDNAWAEKDHATWAAYRLSPDHDWVPYASESTKDKVGRHKDMGGGGGGGGWSDRVYTAVIDLGTHLDDNVDILLPDVSQYVVCGRVTTAQYGTGQVLCSDYIDVSNAAHNAAIPTPTPTPIPDPELTVQVSNRNPVRGETVTLTATLDPHPPGTVTYQWQRLSNGQWSDISGADSAKLRVSSDSRVTRSYQVEVSYVLNGPAVATSSTVDIRWQDAPTATNTPTPTATNTPTPTATNTPTPTATNTPTPTATNTPEPPTATPTPAQSWCELYPDLCCDDEPWHPFCGPYK